MVPHLRNQSFQQRLLCTEICCTRPRPRVVAHCRLITSWGEAPTSQRTGLTSGVLTISSQLVSGLVGSLADSTAHARPWPEDSGCGRKVGLPCVCPEMGRQLSRPGPRHVPAEPQPTISSLQCLSRSPELPDRHQPLQVPEPGWPEGVGPCGMHSTGGNRSVPPPAWMTRRCHSP